jgi:hypothetical protein
MAEAAVELRAILDSAERAVSAQDFASAEHYLRQAAAIQEAQFGPDHPDLANTLNNLGIVFERVGKPNDAEALYRRAYAIATATLAADDPLVLTSGQNLRDFCAATGKPFEVIPPAPVSVAPAPPSASVARPSPQRPPAPRPRPVSQPAVPNPPPAAAVVRSSVRAERAAMTSGRGHSLWIGLAAAIVIVAMIAWFASRPRTSDASLVPTAAPATPAAAPVAREQPAPPKPVAPAPREEVAQPVVETPRATEAPTPAAAIKETSRPASQTAVSVVEARLCTTLSLSNWQCTPATNPVEPGRMFFYTRLKAGGDTTVQHRWYVNGGLLQNVELRVRANSGAGFRTYSRNTVAGERRGTWTVELRDAGGALLHEERFVVQ